MSKKNAWIPAVLLVISLTFALPATAAPSTDTPVVDAWRIVTTWWSSLWNEIGPEHEPIGGTQEIGPQGEPIGTAASGSTAGSSGSAESGPQGEPIGRYNAGPGGAADGSGVGGSTDEIGPEGEPIG